MKPTHIIIHCSASPYGTPEIIEKWHKDRGFDRIGYHYVITNGYTNNSKRYHQAWDGMIHRGRWETSQGAHAYGYNKRSIGICLIGPEDAPLWPRANQLTALEGLVKTLMQKYQIPLSHVLGHNETEGGMRKQCPCFNVDDFRANL